LDLLLLVLLLLLLLLLLDEFFEVLLFDFSHLNMSKSFQIKDEN